MKKIRAKLRRYMLRPTIYMTTTRFLTALALALLLRFVSGRVADGRFLAYAFLLTAAVFALLAWIAYLRLDGIQLPKWMMKRVNIRKKPVRTYGDMIDHVDENPPPAFEDLEDDEKDLCILGADLVCCTAFLLLSFL